MPAALSIAVAYREVELFLDHGISDLVVRSQRNALDRMRNKVASPSNGSHTVS